MRLLSKLSLRAKLLCAFSLLILLIAVTGLSGMGFIHRIYVSISDLRETATPIRQTALDLRAQMTALQEQARQSLHAPTLESLETAREALKVQLDRIEHDLGVTLAAYGTTEAGESLHRLMALDQDFEEAAMAAVAATQISLAAEQTAAEELDQFEKAHGVLADKLTQFITYGEQRMGAREREIKRLLASDPPDPGQIHTTVHTTFTQSYPVLKISYKLLRRLAVYQEQVRRYALESDVTQLAPLRKKAMTQRRVLLKLVKALYNRLERAKDWKKIGLNTLLDTVAALQKGADAAFAAHKAALAAKNVMGEKEQAFEHFAFAFSQELKNFSDFAAVLQGQAEKDASDTISLATFSLVTIMVIGILFGSAMTLVLAHHIVLPLHRLNIAMHRLSEGALEQELVDANRADEIGKMAKAVCVFKQNALANRALQAEKEQAHETERLRHNAIEASIARFDRSVSDVVQAVTSASCELDRTADELDHIARRTHTLAQDSAESAESAFTNVFTVASATGRMTESVTEISRQVTSSATITARAVGQAEETLVTVQNLVDLTAHIGTVTRLIQEIATQTNLLALNATIEASRAGEAGRGFAIVASEVKDLATQTALATDDISQRITALQNATQSTVSAIQDISGTISAMDEISNRIAQAVEEQSAASAQISQSLRRASSSTETVSSNITQVSSAASETGGAAGQVLGSSSFLHNHAAMLEREIETFLSEIRAA